MRCVKPDADRTSMTCSEIVSSQACLIDSTQTVIDDHDNKVGANGGDKVSPILTKRINGYGDTASAFDYAMRSSR
jgi:hypothetical protein